MAFVEKVVKCNGCGKYFGYSEKKTKCPFCHAEYGEVVEGKTEEKKEAKKTQKKSFKIWNDN